MGSTELQAREYYQNGAGQNTVHRHSRLQIPNPVTGYGISAELEGELGVFLGERERVAIDILDNSTAWPE
ncbi:hypothetical protein CK220_23130 [Mesorhizobium sp. WSM3860]|nr:hypothetical protein CK220_23130 [Mesorhizobium sp. WSM3860]